MAQCLLKKISDTQVRLPDGKIYQVPHWHPDWYAAKAHAGHMLDTKIRSLAKQLEMAEKCGGATANLRKALAKWRALDTLGWQRDRLSIAPFYGTLMVVDNHLGNAWLVNKEPVKPQEVNDWIVKFNREHYTPKAGYFF